MWQGEGEGETFSSCHCCSEDVAAAARTLLLLLLTIAELEYKDGSHFMQRMQKFAWS